MQYDNYFVSYSKLVSKTLVGLLQLSKTICTITTQMIRIHGLHRTFGIREAIIGYNIHHLWIFFELHTSNITIIGVPKSPIYRLDRVDRLLIHWQVLSNITKLVKPACFYGEGNLQICATLICTIFIQVNCVISFASNIVSSRRVNVRCKSTAASQDCKEMDTKWRNGNQR